MIPALSFLTNPLAPAPATPVTGDPAAFGALLAEAVGPAVGRQIGVPTGKAVPPVDLLSPVAGSPVMSADDEIADAPPPAPAPPIPVTLAAVSPKPAVATPRPTAWPRFAKPETCAGPADEPRTADAEVKQADPGPPRPAVAVIERDPAVTIDPAAGSAPGPVDREQAASSDPTPPTDLASPAAVIVAVPGTGTPSRPDTSAPKVAIARPVDDGPRSPLPPVPGPAPIPAVARGRMTSVPVPLASGPSIPDPAIPAAPVASGGSPTPDIVDRRTSPVPIPARGAKPLPSTPVTTHVPNARPIVAAAADRVGGPAAALTSVAPPSPPASADRPAPSPGVAAAGPPTGRMTVVPPDPSSAKRPNVAALPLPPLPAAPTRFAVPPLRPSPAIAAPVAPPIAPAAPAAPALVVSADPVVGQAASVAPATTPAALAAPALAVSADPVVGQALSPAPPIAPAAPALVVSTSPVVGQAASPASAAAPVESMSPSFGPRPDAGEPPTPDRLPAAPMPIAGNAPTPTIARAVLSGPARQVFAADLRRTELDLRPVAGEAPAVPSEAVGVGTTVASIAAPFAAPIDLRQDRWPSAMVERIERLRDAVDAVDTRIRLIPDALGTIDVAVKRDGDTVHVHFTAEQAATRALLQDAAPRLAEAAEARGLKLGQTAVGGDGSQPNGRQPQPQQPSAPAPARPRPTAATNEDVADTRIA